MAPRPLIFISAVSKEFRSARQLVANTLTYLGYEPVWQDVFGTDQGDLRNVLREKINQCNGVVQLIGQCYGQEPPTADAQFRRVSYTQYEGLYAEKRGKKVWHLVIDDNFPTDPHEPEPAELRSLQAAYRNRITTGAHLFQSLNSQEGLEATVLKLRNDMVRLRRGFNQWAAGVVAFLVFIVALELWNLHQAKLNPKLLQAVLQKAKAEAHTIDSQPNLGAVAIQDQTYANLAKQLDLDEKLLREKLPEFARQLKGKSNAASYERASAAYVTGDYKEAERLALKATEEPRDTRKSVPYGPADAFQLAGFSADKVGKREAALDHFREAEKLVDPEKNPKELESVQHAIAKVSQELQAQNGQKLEHIKSVNDLKPLSSKLIYKTLDLKYPVEGIVSSEPGTTN